jgi:hypothetical protein
VGGQHHDPAALPRDRPGTHFTGRWLDWRGAENLAYTGIRSPDRPAHSQSLYRLSYRAHGDRYGLKIIYENLNSRIIRDWEFSEAVLFNKFTRMAKTIFYTLFWGGCGASDNQTECYCYGALCCFRRRSTYKRHDAVACVTFVKTHASYQRAKRKQKRTSVNINNSTDSAHVVGRKFIFKKIYIYILKYINNITR